MLNYIRKTGLASLYSIHLMPSGRKSSLNDRNVTNNKELSPKPTRMLAGSQKPHHWTTDAAFVFVFLPVHKWL